MIGDEGYNIDELMEKVEKVKTGSSTRPLERPNPRPKRLRKGILRYLILMKYMQEVSCRNKLKRLRLKL